MKRTALFFLLLIICQPLLAQRALPAAKLQEIERVISSEMARQSIPAASAAIATDSRVVWSGGFGMSDLENFVPAKASTVYRLGSISKPITAVAAMQLVEQGKLDLDAPVQKYVPSFPEKPWPITPRLLLGHQSGIRHYMNEEIDSTRHYTDLLAPLAIFAQDPLLFEPGTKYSYTTYGYCLLGAAVEAAADVRFLDYIQRQIFRPAGMDHIAPDNVYAIVPNRARGYRKSAEGQIENCGLADTSNKIPGGGLISTAEDLVKFGIAVETGKLLRKETVEQMWTRQTLRSGASTGYGLGWHLGELHGKKTVAHGGGQQGTATHLLLVPEPGLVVAVMTNLERAVPARVTTQIAEIVLKP